MKFDYFLNAILFICSIFVIGCNGGSEPVDSFLGSGGSDVTYVPTPTSLQITVNYPVEDDKKVGYQSTISGSCTPAGVSIEISGDATGFSVCTVGGTWSAEIDFSGAPIGEVTAEVKMVDGTNESGTIYKTFVKDNTDCDTESARSGTFANDSSPYFICTPLQLDNMRTNLSASYILKNEINLRSTPFAQINGNFTGALNGNGFSIEGLVINQPSSNEVGLFQYLRDGASVSDLTFRNFSVIGSTRVAVIAARVRNNGATFTNLTFDSGTVTSTGSGAGLITSYHENAGVLTSTNLTASNITINSESYAGVVGGYTNNNSGSSLIVNNTTIDNLSINGSRYIGGVYGYYPPNNNANEINNTTITNSTFTASNSYVGGVVGYMETGNIDTCSVAVDFNTTASSIGGIAGVFNGSSITECTVTGDINIDAADNNKSNIGGLVGYIHWDKGGTFSNLNYTGDIIGSTSNEYSISYVGGGFGVARSGTFSNINIDSDIEINSGNGTSSGGSMYGGFAGLLEARYGDNVSVSDITFQGDMISRSATNDIRVGGFAGYIYAYDSDTNEISINNISISGTLDATNRRNGGFAGEIYVGNSSSSVTASDINIDMPVTVNEYGTNRQAYYNGGIVGTLSTRNRAESVDPSAGWSFSNITQSGNLVASGQQVALFAGSAFCGRTDFGGATCSLNGANSFNGSMTISDGNRSAQYIGAIFGNLSGSQTTIINIDLSNTNTGSGDIASQDAFVGGLAGQLSTSGTINFNNATISRNISSGNGYAGGAFGRISPNGSGIININNVHVIGNPTVTTNTNSYLGGFVGESRGVSAPGAVNYIHSSTSANVIHTDTGLGAFYYIGGFAGGDSSNNNFTDCFATGNITTNGRNGYVGGFTGGSTSSDRSFINSYATGDIVMNLKGNMNNIYAGGFAGYINNNSLLENVYATGDVTFNNIATTNNAYIGGLVGLLNGSSSITNSYASGNVYVSANSGNTDFVGGLTGLSNGPIYNSVAFGNVSSTGSYIGGLSGTHSNYDLKNSASFGEVYGRRYVGGLVGNYTGSGVGQVDNVYSTGSVSRVDSSSSFDRFGELFGECDSDSYVLNAYYNSDTSIVDANVTTPWVTCNTSTARDLTDLEMGSCTNFAGFDCVGTNDNSWRYSSSYIRPTEEAVLAYPVPYWFYSIFP